MYYFASIRLNRYWVFILKIKTIVSFLVTRPIFWIFWESSRELINYLTSTNNFQSIILMKVIRVGQNLNPKFRLKNENLFLFCCFLQVFYFYLLGNSSQHKLSLTVRLKTHLSDLRISWAAPDYFDGDTTRYLWKMPKNASYIAKEIPDLYNYCNIINYKFWSSLMSYDDFKCWMLFKNVWSFINSR